MTDKEKIKAEVKRMADKDYPCDNSEQNAGYATACDQLLDFIDELPEEPMNKDLTEAAIEYAATGELLPNGKEMINFDLQKAFMAGAQWYRDEVWNNTDKGSLVDAVIERMRDLDNLPTNHP